MAGHQKKEASHSISHTLVDTFFGSFRRFLGTCAVGFAIFAMLFPENAKLAVSRVVGVVASALAPFVPLIGTLIIIYFGLKIMLKAFSK